MLRRFLTPAALLAMLVAMALALTGCLSGGGGDSSSQSVSLTITSSSGSITADGASSTVLTVVVRDGSGELLGNATVTLSTTLGQLLSSSLTTNGTGAVTTSLISGTVAGRATVVARSGSVTNSISVQFTAGPAAKIQDISAAPSVPEPGASTTLQARVLDQFDNPVSGVKVYFQAVQNQSGGDFESGTGSADTDTGGWATVAYTAGPNSGADAFRVMTDELVADANLQLSVVPFGREIVSIQLTVVGDASIPADGQSSTILQAEVLDAYGLPIQGVTVNFANSLGTLANTSVTTNEDGQARVSLIAGDAPGQCQITATSGAVLDSTYVYFVSTVTEIGSIDLTIVGDDTIPADGSSSTTLEVEVLDASGDPLQGIAVNLTAASGSFSNDVVTTDENGKARFTVIASNTAGEHKITAEADGVTDSVYVTYESDPQATVGSVSLAVNDETSSIPADGVSSLQVEVSVLDTQGQPMANVYVAVSSSRGSVSNYYVVTDESGKATFNVIADAQGGQALVHAQAGSAQDSLYVTFLAVHVISVFCVDDQGEVILAPTVFGDGTSSVWVRAIVQDSFGLPMPNAQVIFSSDDPTLGVATPARAASNEEGLAHCSLIGQAGQVGTVKVTGQVGTVTDSVYIDVVAAP